MWGGNPNHRGDVGPRPFPGANPWAMLLAPFRGNLKKGDTNLSLVTLQRDIFMYGSDKVFKAFNKWLLSTTNSNDKTQFAAFLDFVLEMRKDLCNNKTKLTKHDILLNLTQSEDEAKKLFE